MCNKQHTNSCVFSEEKIFWSRETRSVLTGQPCGSTRTKQCSSNRLRVRACSYGILTMLIPCSETADTRWHHSFHSLSANRQSLCLNQCNRKNLEESSTHFPFHDAIATHPENCLCCSWHRAATTSIDPGRSPWRALVRQAATVAATGFGSLLPLPLLAAGGCSHFLPAMLPFHQGGGLHTIDRSGQAGLELAIHRSQ